MQITGGHQIHSELRGLIVEASLALARLDAGRLEELAQCCRALNGDHDGNLDERSELQRQAREASREMEVFGRVLDATRANLEVMNRMRERKRGGLEYPAGRGTGWTPWSLEERCDGNR
jgi:hypothetical protein